MQASKTLHLKLDRLGLQTFPLEIVAMSQLKSLDIRANEIQSLPSAIGKVRGQRVRVAMFGWGSTGGRAAGCAALAACRATICRDAIDGCFVTYHILCILLF